MAYTVTTTSGTTVATIQDGTVNTTATSLTLIGKNYAGYGIFLNENYVTLLENFSNSTPPSAPLTGQLWYDNVNDVLKVFNAASNIWKPISSSISQSTAPSAAVSVTGDIWWDTTNAQLKVWSGSAWITIGPSYTSTAGTSGAVVETILDQSAAPHVVVKFYISNSAIAILSKDTPAFTPQTPISGFSSIVPGLNLISSTTLTGAQFTGATSGASTLGGYTASQFLLKDTAQSTTGKLTLSGGLQVGSDLVFDTSSGTDAYIGPTLTNNKNLQIQLQTNGVAATVLNLTATSKLATFAGPVTSTGNLTASSYSIFNNTLLPVGTVNIGSSTSKFANIYSTYYVGTSVQAQYADLAEKYLTDQEYPVGTVVAVGGSAEATAAAHGDRAFGVVSASPAYLMNAESQGQAIALKGRVPVIVQGTVKKGDKLVPAHDVPGAASTADANDVNYFAIALGDHQEGSGTVECLIL